jgi:hypothetical protein
MELKNRRPDVFETLSKLGCAYKRTVRLGLDMIKHDQGIYPREKTDWERVQLYKEAMEEGAQFPPIIIAEDYTLLDGNHRFYAYKELGIDEIEAEVWEVPENLKPIFAQAVNTEKEISDTPLTTGEKKKAILRDWEILSHSPKQERIETIAKILKTSVSYVRKVLAQAGYIEDLREKMKARALELSQAGLSTRQIAKLLEEEFGEKVSHMTIARWLSPAVTKFTRVKNVTPPDNNPQSPANNPTPNPNHLDRDKRDLLEFILADAELHQYDPVPYVQKHRLVDYLTEEDLERIDAIREKLGLTKEEDDEVLDTGVDNPAEEVPLEEEEEKPQKPQPDDGKRHLEWLKFKVREYVLKIIDWHGEEEAIEFVQQLYQDLLNRRYRTWREYADLFSRYQFKKNLKRG